MSTDFGKQFAKLVAETLELQQIEMEAERQRLKVSRMQYELEAFLGVDARVTVPVSRSVQ